MSPDRKPSPRYAATVSSPTASYSHGSASRTTSPAATDRESRRGARVPVEGCDPAPAAGRTRAARTAAELLPSLVSSTGRACGGSRRTRGRPALAGEDVGRQRADGVVLSGCCRPDEQRHQAFLHPRFATNPRAQVTWRPLPPPPVATVAAVGGPAGDHGDVEEHQGEQCDQDSGHDLSVILLTACRQWQ